MDPDPFDDFDAEEAARARDDAIDRVDRHADEDWKQAAYMAIEEVARLREFFTTDAIWSLTAKAGIPEPHERRAMGAVMGTAHRAGWVEPTDRIHLSVRVACHRRPLRVWHSRLYEGASS